MAYDPTKPPVSLQDVIAASPTAAEVTGDTELLTSGTEKVKVQNLPFGSWTKGVYIGTSAPPLISYAQFVATKTGYWSWIDITAAGGVVNTSATLAAASGQGSAAAVSAAATRYITAALSSVAGTGSAASILATASQDGVVNASATLAPASGTGSASAVTAAAVSFAAATVAPASGTGAASPVSASAVGFASATLASAAGTGTAASITATEVSFAAATVAPASGTGAASPITATATAPTVPTQPIISATGGDTTVTIALLSGGTGATSYDLKWGTSAGSRTNTISGVTLPYTHTGRSNGTTYYYSLVATNTEGSTESAEVSATAAVPPAANYTFDTDDQGFTGNNLSWSATGGRSGGCVTGTATTIDDGEGSPIQDTVVASKTFDNAVPLLAGHTFKLYIKSTGVYGSFNISASDGERNRVIGNGLSWSYTQTGDYVEVLVTATDAEGPNASAAESITVTVESGVSIDDSVTLWIDDVSVPAGWS